MTERQTWYKMLTCNDLRVYVNNKKIANLGKLSEDDDGNLIIVSNCNGPIIRSTYRNYRNDKFIQNKETGAIISDNSILDNLKVIGYEDMRSLQDHFGGWENLPSKISFKEICHIVGPEPDIWN